MPYDDVHDLRVAWLRRTSRPRHARLHRPGREVAERRGAQVLAVREGGAPVGYAQLEYHDGSAEIAQVYVHPDHRGRGLGTAITCAAIHAEAGPGPLDRRRRRGPAKDLYERLGFEPAWTATEITRLP